MTLAATPTADGYGGTTENELVYVEQIKAMRYSEITTLYVDFSHLLDRDDVLARAISDQYYRYVYFPPHQSRRLMYLLDFYHIFVELY